MKCHGKAYDRWKATEILLVPNQLFAAKRTIDFSTKKAISSFVTLVANFQTNPEEINPNSINSDTSMDDEAPIELEMIKILVPSDF
jgi:hypothetical protein